MSVLEIIMRNMYIIHILNNLARHQKDLAARSYFIILYPKSMNIGHYPFCHTVNLQVLH